MESTFRTVGIWASSVYLEDHKDVTSCPVVAMLSCSPYTTLLCMIIITFYYYHTLKVQKKQSCLTTNSVLNNLCFNYKDSFLFQATYLSICHEWQQQYSWSFNLLIIIYTLLQNVLLLYFTHKKTLNLEVWFCVYLKSRQFGYKANHEDGSHQEKEKGKRLTIVCKSEEVKIEYLLILLKKEKKTYSVTLGLISDRLVSFGLYYVNILTPIEIRYYYI